MPETEPVRERVPAVPLGAGDASRAPAVDLGDPEPGAQAVAVDSTLAESRTRRSQPGFGPAVMSVLLPVVLMLLRAIGELTLPTGTSLRATLGIAGTPVVAMRAGVILGMFSLGMATGMTRERTTGDGGEFGFFTRRSPGAAGRRTAIACKGRQ